MTPIAGRLSDMYEDLSKKELPVNQANQFHHSILQPVYKCGMLVRPTNSKDNYISKLILS